MQDMGNMCAV